MAISQRWIHIDLKGLCPTVPSLIESLRRFVSMGANGFLFEIEDMFPYEHASQSVRPDCYSIAEWKEIIKVCRELEAEFIPLIQTLGHLEWLLWHDDFTHLRAVDDNNKGVTATVSIYQVHPCNEEAIQLILSLADEVIDCHGDLRYIHLGGDETWFEGADPGEDYLRHMIPILDHVISRGIRPMIWSDMILSYFPIIDRLPGRTVIADWMYSHREQFGNLPEIWGEKHVPFEKLSERRKQEFGEHLFRGLEYGGEQKHNFPFPSYLKAKNREVFVVPAGQCCGDRFSMPTLYWKFENGRSYIQEGHECGAAGCINSDWIIRRNARELTRICHFGFLKNALTPEHPLSNSEIIAAYWNDISPGCGEKAAELFDSVAGIRAITWEESAPIGHNPDSQYWRAGDLMDKLDQSGCRPADADDAVVRRMEVKRTGGETVAEFCNSVLSVMSGPKGERRAEAEAWRLAGLDTALRARIWLCIRKEQQGRDVLNEKKKIVADLKLLEQETRVLWEGRYLPEDIQRECGWRFSAVSAKLS